MIIGARSQAPAWERQCLPISAWLISYKTTATEPVICPKEIFMCPWVSKQELGNQKETVLHISGQLGDLEPWFPSVLKLPGLGLPEFSQFRGAKLNLLNRTG